MKKGEKITKPYSRRPISMSKDELTLVFAWLENRIPMTEFSRRMGFKTHGDHEYSFLATRLREAYRRGILIRG